MPSLRPPPEPGLWWSPLDPLVVLVAGASTILLALAVGPFAGLVPMVVGHSPWRP